MTRIVLLLLPFLYVSCSSTIDNELDGRTLMKTEIIQHSSKGSTRYQVIYSTLTAQGISFQDTSAIIQHFRDSLLLEEIRYDILDSDSIKWSHKIQRYNSSGLLISETDSIEGQLSRQSLFEYKDGRLSKNSHFTILVDYNDLMEQTGLDTVDVSDYYHYDDDGNVSKIVSLRRNKFSESLTGLSKMDTTITQNQYDDDGNKIGSTAIKNKEIINSMTTEYDEAGRKIRVEESTLGFGSIITRYKYDKQGNLIFEERKSEESNELTSTSFDSQNRPIKRKTYM